MRRADGYVHTTFHLYYNILQGTKLMEKTILRQEKNLGHIIMQTTEGRIEYLEHVNKCWSLFYLEIRTNKSRDGGLETVELKESKRSTFFASCTLLARRTLASSAICWWKTSTAASRALASFSFSSRTVRHTFHMFLHKQTK